MKRATKFAPRYHEHNGVRFCAQAYVEEPNRHSKQSRVRWSWYIVGSSKVNSGLFSHNEAVAAAKKYIAPGRHHNNEEVRIS